MQVQLVSRPLLPVFLFSVCLCRKYKVKRPRKYHNQDEQHQMKSIQSRKNKDKTNVTYETTDAQTKTNFNRRTDFEHSVGNQLGFKPALFAQSLTLNSDAAPNK